MRYCRSWAMLLVAAACLLSSDVSPARAADWLGGPYWGRISGCGHCGSMMYGHYKACCCCQGDAGIPVTDDSGSTTRIVRISKPEAVTVSHHQPAPAVRGEQIEPAAGRKSGCACGNGRAKRSSGGAKLGGKAGCGGCRRGGGIEGDDDGWYNCGCNGSYKFPVPPLYTYHWPGMYSHQLMTDYHSPWRFPPLRPYTDEPEGDYLGQSVPPFATVPAHVAPAAAAFPSESPTAQDVAESMSEKMRRLYR